ncbi:hypothetical protein D1BOALGB6SA_6474 [Olavius sp. associated proteobacterium Delta 1]|nr:hypothetical protein D1BOALGB6SA_6474 [Olavius sp. associated proteobacterium Delta 1]
MWSQGLILAKMRAIQHGRKDIPDRSDLLKPQSIQLLLNVKLFFVRLIDKATLARQEKRINPGGLDNALDLDFATY